MVLETERLVESRRLLEAHARLMELERWQDDILWQLNGAAGASGSALSSEDQELVAKYFSGVGQLVEALGEETRHSLVSNISSTGMTTVCGSSVRYGAFDMGCMRKLNIIIIIITLFREHSSNKSALQHKENKRQ